MITHDVNERHLQRERPCVGPRSKPGPRPEDEKLTWTPVCPVRVGLLLGFMGSPPLKLQLTKPETVSPGYRPYQGWHHDPLRGSSGQLRPGEQPPPPPPGASCCRRRRTRNLLWLAGRETRGLGATLRTIHHSLGSTCLRSGRGGNEEGRGPRRCRIPDAKPFAVSPSSVAVVRRRFCTVVGRCRWSLVIVFCAVVRRHLSSSPSIAVVVRRLPHRHQTLPQDCKVGQSTNTIRRLMRDNPKRSKPSILFPPFSLGGWFHLVAMGDHHQRRRRPFA